MRVITGGEGKPAGAAQAFHLCFFAECLLLGRLAKRHNEVNMALINSSYKAGNYFIFLVNNCFFGGGLCFIHEDTVRVGQGREGRERGDMGTCSK